MVFQLPIRVWCRLKALGVLACLITSAQAGAQDLSAFDALRDARALYASGQYFKSARYAFGAKDDPVIGPQAYAWVTGSLVRAGLIQSAAYFFIRTLQTGDKTAIRKVLLDSEFLLVKTGPDLLRRYLIRHSTYEDYDLVNRSAYLYSLGKQSLLEGNESRAIGYINGMSSKSPLWPFALQLRATANSIIGKNAEAVSDFKECQKQAKTFTSDQKREGEDLLARCLAGEARTQYQKTNFKEADRVYDQIPKESIVWPDVLFEQAWTSFARQEYNRTLGKLVTYKAPALEFVFKSEIEVLRAQTYLMLCMYSDANQSINEFNSKYAGIGEEVKTFVEKNASNLGMFYDLGRAALADSIYSKKGLHRLSNQFVRGPYFQSLVAAEKALGIERQAIRTFALRQSGMSKDLTQGFPGFLEVVLSWRGKSIRALGGAFVKNSLLDHHAALIADFEKIAFIKLEMLSRAKEKLLSQKLSGERIRGNVLPSRRDDQYYWSFNGEFWNDELGDYVFGLESECGSG